jgi:hypothetical protein
MPKRIFSDALEAALEPNRVAFTALIGAGASFHASVTGNSLKCGLDVCFVRQTVV